MSRYKQTVAPTGATVVTLQEAKDQLRITSEDDDVYLAGLIDKAEQYVERQTERQLRTATWTLTLDEFPDEIELRVLPIATITSIVYTDSNGTSQTLAAASYQTEKTSPDVPARIQPAYGLTWPSTRSDTLGAVVVTFTAGYGAASAVPVLYRHAILLVIAHWFQLREPLNIGNIVNPLPHALDSLLSLGSWGSYA